MSGVRSIWKGALSVSLVSIPVKLIPAHNGSGATISFKQLHCVCHGKVKQPKWCPSCNREVTMDEIRKGYEFEPDRFVELTEAELDAIKLESTHTIHVSRVADASALDPVTFDAHYFVAPDGKDSAEAYAVIRRALEGRAAFATITMRGRETELVLRVRGRAIMATTLCATAEVRSDTVVNGLDAVPAVEDVTMCREMFDNLATVPAVPFVDGVEVATRKLIDAKIRGDVVKVEAPVTVSRAVSFRDMLKASAAGTKPMAKAPLEQPKKRRAKVA